jgi:cytochrome c-type biogenesis protein CcmE
VIALSVAAVLAVFLLYTSIAGGGNPSLAPSELAGHTGTVQLAGLVVGPVSGDAHAGGLRFGLRDIGGGRTTTVAVRYAGSVPDLFKVGRHIVVDGQLERGTFVAEPGSMITKCPSKYAPKKSTDSV